MILLTLHFIINSVNNNIIIIIFPFLFFLFFWWTVSFVTLFVSTRIHTFYSTQAMSSLCVVGYIFPRLLEALCQVDQRLKRVLTRNYHRALLNSVRFHVPMLR